MEMRRIAFGTIIMACLLMVGCKSDDEPESTGSIAVTGNASNISLTEATVYGNASVARLGLVASQCVIGVEYDVASDDFSSPATYVAQGVSGSLFTCNLSNLLPNTTYQYRAYVEAQGMVYYGEKESFTTQSFGNIASCESFSNLTTRTDVLSVGWIRYSLPRICPTTVIPLLPTWMPFQQEPSIIIVLTQVAMG